VAYSQFFKPSSEEKRGQEDWKTVYLQNIGKFLIGVYNTKSNQIILLPSMPSRIWVVYEGSVNGIVVGGWKLDRHNHITEGLSKENIEELNEKYKDAIPRYYKLSSWSEPERKQVGHMCMLEKMGQDSRDDDFRGFSVTPSIPPSKTNFIWISGSLNGVENDGLVTPMLQKEIFEQIESALSPKSGLVDRSGSPVPASHSTNCDRTLSVANF
jgi:hypothetical protein